MRPIPGTVTDPAMDGPREVRRHLIVGDDGTVFGEYLTAAAATAESSALRHQGVDVDVITVWKAEEVD